MKITYVIDFLYSINGGTERQLYLLIRGMVSLGHEVDLYVLRETEFTRDLEDFPCPVICLGIDSVLSLAGLRALWQFRRTLVSRKTDVVHGFFNDVAMILPPLMTATGMKVYTSRRDIGIWYSFMRLFFLRLYKFTRTRLFCNSLAVADFARQKEWKSREDIVVIYNGIEHFDVESGCAKVDWAPKREENSAEVNIVLVANVRPVKRIEDLVKAASLLSHEGVPFRYWVVGHLSDELYYKSLQSLLKQYQVENDFHFVGPVLEPRAALSQFDVGVLTSASEGLSNTIMEYLDAGLPVVASRVGGNQELVIDGFNGYLYQVGDADALAQHIRALIKDPDLRRKLGANALEHTCRFSAATMISLHEEDYTS